MQFKLSKEQNEKLKAFSVEVIERNKLHNLTGYKNAQNFFNEQIIDSVTALRSCRKSLQDDIVDCGSGAGVPAIVWAILDPQKTFHSIDKNQKKIFISLVNLKVIKLVILVLLKMVCFILLVELIM
mgnify:CR=1 FL=1